MKKHRKIIIAIVLMLMLIPILSISVSAEEGTESEHVHRFAGSPKFKRQPDNTWTAYFYCADGCGFSETVDCNVEVEYGTPTCTEDAYNDYTISVEYYGEVYTTTHRQRVSELGHDFTNGPCSRCGLKPQAALDMPKIKIYTYSGKPYTVTLNNADELAGEVIYKYYVNSARTKETTPENSGASENGGAPVNVGRYYVKAIYLEDDTYRRTPSATCALVIKPKQVKSLTVSNHQDGVKLSWSKCPGADHYTIFRRTQNGSFIEVGSIEGDAITSCIDVSAPIGKYIYNITATFRSVDRTFVESNKRVSGSIIYHNKLTITNTKSGAKLKWGKISGAAGYYVYRKTKGQTSFYKVKTITNAKTVTWTDTTSKSIVNGRKSTYYIKPYFKASTSGYLKTANVVNYFLSRPTAKRDGRNLVWNNNKYATGYVVSRTNTLGYISTYNRTSSVYKNFFDKSYSNISGKVRAYKKVNGVRYYSAWSPVVNDDRFRFGR